MNHIHADLFRVYEKNLSLCNLHFSFKPWSWFISKAGRLAEECGLNTGACKGLLQKDSAYKRIPAPPACRAPTLQTLFFRTIGTWNWYGSKKSTRQKRDVKMVGGFRI